MLRKLQNKWGVSLLSAVLILCVFAIGGSLSGYLAKHVLGWTRISNRVVWLIVYIAVVTVLWPLAVTFISIFFGQYRFFKSYLGKMAARLRIVSKRSG